MIGVARADATAVDIGPDLEGEKRDGGEGRKWREEGERERGFGGCALTRIMNLCSSRGGVVRIVSDTEGRSNEQCAWD